MPPAVQQRSFSDLETLLIMMWVTRLSYYPELLISALPSLSVMEVRSSSPETRNSSQQLVTRLRREKGAVDSLVVVELRQGRLRALDVPDVPDLDRPVLVVTIIQDCLSENWTKLHLALCSFLSQIFSPSRVIRVTMPLLLPATMVLVEKETSSPVYHLSQSLVSVE